MPRIRKILCVVGVSKCPVPHPDILAEDAEFLCQQTLTTRLQKFYFCTEGRSLNWLWSLEAAGACLITYKVVRLPYMYILDQWVLLSRGARKWIDGVHYWNIVAVCRWVPTCRPGRDWKNCRSLDCHLTSCRPMAHQLPPQIGEYSSPANCRGQPLRHTHSEHRSPQSSRLG